MSEQQEIARGLGVFCVSSGLPFVIVLETSVVPSIIFLVFPITLTVRSQQTCRFRAALRYKASLFISLRKLLFMPLYNTLFKSNSHHPGTGRAAGGGGISRGLCPAPRGGGCCLRALGGRGARSPVSVRMCSWACAAGLDAPGWAAKWHFIFRCEESALAAHAALAPPRAAPSVSVRMKPRVSPCFQKDREG